MAQTNPFWKERPENFQAILNSSCKGDMQEGEETYLYKHKLTGRHYCMLNADLERMRGEPQECQRTNCPIHAYVITGVQQLTNFLPT